VEVRARGEVVASSTRALLLAETALPNRFYLPREDVRAQLRGPADTTSFCPYKGTASYYSLVLDDGAELADAAWSYEDPYAESAAIAGLVSFWGDDVEISVTSA
jgi:uncharacterized protein (DUF427 family)